MGELAIRRNRGISVPKYQAAEKTEKTQGTEPSKVLRPAAQADSRLTSGTVQAGNRLRESRQILRTGEGVLAEVGESLERMAELARQASEEDGGDREALQNMLESLKEGIRRMTASSANGTALFLDDGPGSMADVEALLTVLNQEAPTLPDWLTSALTKDVMSPEEILEALGLDGTAGAREIAAALAGLSPEGDEMAAYLASLYLGSVIAGSSDVEAALEGLQQLLDRIAEGQSPDQAIAELTGGIFDSFAGFQAQFSQGSAPGLEAFLLELMGGMSLPGETLMDLLELLDGVNLQVLMDLMAAMGESGVDLLDIGIGTQEGQGVLPPSLEAALAGAEANAAQGTAESGGTFPAAGADLSGVTFDAQTGTLTIAGDAPVVVLGRNLQNIQTIRITGNAPVILSQVHGEMIQIDTSRACLFTLGSSRVGSLQLLQSTDLTLGGQGRLDLETVEGDKTSVLRLTGGAVTVREPLPLPVVMAGLASLMAKGTVTDQDGRPLAPLDLLWKMVLPGWAQLTGLSVNGREAHLATALSDGALRLWLDRGERGNPFYTVGFRGRDTQGRPRIHYASLRWYQGSFQEVVRYPNPFTVTGGEAGKDWVYEEETQTLWILTSQVTAIAGGTGTDREQQPFSGRLALIDRLGESALTLGGVVCRVSCGGAFRLGRGNQVTLDLRSGSENIFESGGGQAGISLGEGTSVMIDCSEAQGRNPAGTLFAQGGEEGGAGIGRDSGDGRDRTGGIEIRGGEITARGQGGGAGIGGGREAPLGPLTIVGGTVYAYGSGGGAGIGGGLGGPVGDITIRGGAITAGASEFAAAIGAGVRGRCGSIRISGTARIVKALGGDPGADIGACLTGECGRVVISGGADTGSAGLRRQGGIPLEMGGAEAVTLPQFRLSGGALGLDRISVATREAARAAGAVIDSDRRWVSMIQEVYGTLSGRLERRLLRDTSEAGSLLRDTRQKIPLQRMSALSAYNRAKEIKELLR